MEQNAEYHRQYRKQRGAEFERMMRSIDGKLDRILGVLAEKILEKKIIFDEPVTFGESLEESKKKWVVQKPVVKAEPQTAKEFDHLKNVKPLVTLVCKCGLPAHYKDDNDLYCAVHSTKDSRAI